MPKPKKSAKQKAARANTSRAKESATASAGQAVRPIWSGTITFGLVSIPVDLLSAVRPRQTAMKLVDKEGHALGREYHCSKDGQTLANDALVRGYETDDGKMVVITDDEFNAVAPEMSADIRLMNFVPLAQIPPIYFQKSYFLAPSGKSATAYNLLAATMKNTSRAGIGSFVMRGHEYLVAIVADNGVLRADTLRYADEIRTPANIGLPARSKSSSTMLAQFVKEIEDLKRDDLSMGELEDEQSDELQALVKEKKKDSKNVIQQRGLEADEEDDTGQSAQILDLTALLRRSLSKRVVVTNAGASAPISLDERRAQRVAASGKAAAKKRSGGSKARKSTRD